MTKKKLKKKNKKKPANGQITEKPTNTKLNIVTNTITMPPSVLTPPATPSPANSNESLNNNKNNNINKEDVMSVPQRKAWERELIGSFLLNMADNQVISGKSDWYVDKGNMRRKFEKLLCAKPQGPELRVKLNVNGPYNIGALLFSTNFLMNTPRGDSNYRIKSVALMDYRREKYNAMDEIQRRNGYAAVSITTDATDKNNEPLTQRYKLDENAKSLPLKYQKTQEQQCDNKFELSSWGCYICQCNFDSIEKYEEHIEYHGDESDFQSLQKMTKHAQPMLNLSYQTCVDSHYFGFTLATQLKDIVIEKIIIVLLRQFYYVDNNRLPLQVSDDGQLVFFVDSHVFMILREQPIVIGFSQLVNGKRQHYVEQHHFMRTEELPKASFNVNPYRLSKEKTFRGGRLNPAVPAEKVLAALKLNPQDVQVQLAEYNADYRDYCELGRDLTQKNFYGALGTLLQLEDIEQLQCYVSLTQYKMDLHQFGRELSVKIQPSMRSSSIEDVLSPGDSVLIINEGKTNGVRKLLEDSDLILKLTLMDYDALIAWGHKITEKFGAADKERKEPRVYFAHILAVSTHRVNITCDRKLPDNTTFSLIFRPIRAVLRYQYRALEQLKLTNADHVQRLLFPSTFEEQPLVGTGKMMYYNKNINGNPEQQTAVKQIALTPTLPAPYIIFGPPGTGKTATICEAITQLYIGRPETRILVLAGSNTACDEVALRLLRSISKTPSQAHPLVRVFSASCDRRVDNIDDLLLEYSNMYGMHFYPDVQAVHDYRIVVCTLSLAGKLSTGGFGRDDYKRNVFTHVFVDEAAASTEAELLMGITSTISATTNLILSGDHKQLGPVLQSQRALDWGLGVSLFERLMQRECYRLDENGDYNKAIQTRLRRNYRSHPEIVALYNNLYYDGELISEASLKRVCLAKNWFHTTNEEFPIMFHSVFGTTMNTQNSISLCNNKEIDVVMDYVKDLMYFGINGKKVAQTDIGIISPYKSQYQRIQEQLNMRSWHQIDCGSVELFQGKEKQIIIVSFVRSFTEKLGFLNNNRRLNVLLSRPMSLLILIGNPRTLSKNEDFRHIIDVCRAHKTLVGSIYYPDNDKLNETNNHKNGYRQATAANTSDAPTLAQKFKRTTTNNKPPISTAAAKMVYNKDELLKLGAKKEKPAIKSELEQLFDDLPSVPRYVDHDSDAVRSIQKDMQNLTINKGKTAAASSSRATCPNTTVSSLNEAMLSGLSAGSTSRPIYYATEARESMHAPSAPPASPSPHRSQSTYSHIPSGSSRFEQVRPPHRLQDEYQRPPPFYYSSPYASAPPPPKPEKKKNTCVVS